MPSDTPQDLTDAVTEAALGPASTTVDGTQTQFQNLKDLDDVARRRKSSRSVRTAHRGVFTNKIVPPGTT